MLAYHTQNKQCCKDRPREMSFWHTRGSFILSRETEKFQLNQFNHLKEINHFTFISSPACVHAHIEVRELLPGVGLLLLPCGPRNPSQIGLVGKGVYQLGHLASRIFYIFEQDRVSLCSPGSSGNCFIDQAELVSDSLVLGLQACHQACHKIALLS